MPSSHPITKGDLVGPSRGGDPYGYGESVRQVVEDQIAKHPNFAHLLGVTPENLRIDVHGEDVTVYAGHNCPPGAEHLLQKRLQKLIDDTTTDTPVTVHVVRDR